MEFLKQPLDTKLQSLIERRVVRIFSPLEWFVRRQASASILLLLAAILSIVLVNSPWHAVLPSIAEIRASVSLDQWRIDFSVIGMVNDGLISLFFLLLGLEIKREIKTGSLNHPRKVAFISCAAIGGMVVPALIYAGFNYDGTGRSGWAIPMATDTAFSIGVLAMLSRYVSLQASIFLAALAIFDDIGAIVIIAIFYSSGLNADALFLAMVLLACLCLLNLAGMRSVWLYILFGSLFWWYIHESGVHSTLAGILIAFTIPARARISQRSFINRMRGQIALLEKNSNVDSNILQSTSQHMQMSNMGETVRCASTPLQQWYTLLRNPISIIVLPIFALFNVGIELSANTLEKAYASPVALGVFLGLVIGKPLGVVVFGLIAKRTKLGLMPEGMPITDLLGVGIVAGIGFTMSLFISKLAFAGNLQMEDAAKIGILLAAMFSAVLAFLFFTLSIRCKQRRDCEVKITRQYCIQKRERKNESS